ncbi:precorrin-6A synthase (deacetylating) [Rhodococcus triatomae]|uniref:Precorrin-6A synthase n=1 Tax=Rhodococcus triatomae TaxID=300028 RepID=A0A1G8AHG5_9NOCA|nr:precorrin-6A synthase (deacetylating) [Rhodococcus triatomae]QNG17765.1 precorrin-6A synthase (deacetylating) [Rhodococcus triatomae]QNG22567.1 precorrin-6A synthase (deacetylating) [Rhodococcus triatomae]SDH20402.1 precorrin-6A synthase [Rhodococcus triatomae]
MRELLVIGIGAGDPDQVTVQAVKAMNRADVFFVLGKGAEKDDLVAVRTGILAEHVRRPHRIVEIADPPRNRTPDDYEGVVDDWHERRAARFEEHFGAVDGVGAILVWGDPSLYDSTLRIVERVLARGRVAFEYSVVPGVTSVQSLAAQHRTVLNRIGEPIHVTTGRRLAADPAQIPDSTVVMLDAHCTFTQVPGDDVDIWWGAYLGTPDEVLVSGNLRDVEDEIVRLRGELRERKGWIMDTYLLRRR